MFAPLLPTLLRGDVNVAKAKTVMVSVGVLGLLSVAGMANVRAEEVILRPLAGPGVRPAPQEAVPVQRETYSAADTEAASSETRQPETQQVESQPVQHQAITPVATPIETTIPQNWDEPILRGSAPAATPEDFASQEQASQAGEGKTAIQVTTSTEKVPTGTVLKIAFNNAMDSRVSETGEPFSATLQEDFYTLRRVDGEPEKRVILPQGTMLRGRASDVKRPGLFSRGGAISLSFDHVVLPSGELLPLAMNLSNTNPIVNEAGSLYTDPGVGKKVNQGVKFGFGTFSKVKDATVKVGENAGGDLGKLFAAPFAVTGGAIAGSAVITGKTVVAIVGKGDSVVINPGDTLSIDFAGSFSLPSQ